MEYYCNIQIKKKKKVVDFGRTWGEMRRDEANASFIKTGDGLYVIDVDTKIVPNKYQEWFDSLGTPTVETKRGYHFYVKSKVKMKSSQNIFDDPSFKVDIRGEGGLIFTNYWGDSKKVSYKKVGETIKDKNKAITKTLPDKATTSPKRNNVEQRTDVGEMELSEIKRLLKNVNIKDYQDRGSWMQMLASIYHAGGSDAEKIARKWSKKDKANYDKSSFDNVWRQLEGNKYGTDVSVGTLIYASNGVKSEPETIFKKEMGSVGKSKKKGLVKEKSEDKKFSFNGMVGLMTDAELERQANEIILIEGLVGHGYHTVLYGEAGSNKTTVSAWACIQMLKQEEHKDRMVQFWAFDSDRVHNNEIYKYGKGQGVSDRFMFSTGASKVDFFNYYDMAIKQQVSLDNVLIVIDTYKFLSNDVNNKTSNKDVLHYIKKLQKLGASILTLAHANKDSKTFSGTSELSQDTDAVLRIHRERDGTTGDIITTIKEDARCRFAFPTGGITIMSNGDGVKGGDYHRKILNTLKKVDNISAVSDIQTDVFEEVKRKEEEAKRQLLLDEVRDKTYIYELRRIIKTLNKDKYRNCIPSTIINDAKAEGMTDKQVRTILLKYNDKHWKSKMKKLKGGVKPIKHYKLIKSDKG